MLKELGHEVSAAGVAGLWSELIDVLLIDDADARIAKQVAAASVVPYVTDTIMGDPTRGAALARSVLSAANLVRQPLRN